MATMNVRGHKQEEGSQAKPPLQQSATSTLGAKGQREGRGRDSPDSPRARKHSPYRDSKVRGARCQVGARLRGRVVPIFGCWFALPACSAWRLTPTTECRRWHARRWALLKALRASALPTPRLMRVSKLSL